MQQLATDLEKARAVAHSIVENVKKVIIGKDEAVELGVVALTCQGHTLIEDVPGVGKTMLARSIARSTGSEFKRIQFTPDLLPTDITGVSIFNQKSGEFEFRQGPIISQIVLADEINRATPKTQSALLEAMQERQVTVEGERFALEKPFVVIATQNPVEFEGTYPLPEAQLDRFIMRTSIGYPSAEDEYEILRRRQERKEDTVDLKPVVSHEELLAMQLALEDVHVSEPIGTYIVDLTRATREDSKVQVGASPRGVYALFKLARAHAVLNNRDFVTPEDVKDVAVVALAHRIVMKPEYWVRGISDESIVTDAMNEVPTPQAEA